MASSRINLVQGTSDSLNIDLLDHYGEPLEMAELVGASATFLLRVQATDVGDVVAYTTPDAHLVFDEDEPTLILSFVPTDTDALALGAYVFRVRVTFSDGDVLDVVEWSPLQIGLGGVAEVVAPVFTNTVVVDHDYELSNNLRYVTPGGDPIENAQIRLYYKSDYDAGDFSTPVGVTTTDADGRWVNPIHVYPGFTYTVQFFAPAEYGPDTSTIIA